ncbi:MAG: AI-2E family transporter [Lachnospiraceae bacterium]
MKLEWKTCLKVGVSIFLLYLCIFYWPTLSSLIVTLIGASTPLLIGCAVAYVVNILMNLFEKHYFPKTKKTMLINSRRPVCMTLAFVTVVAAIALLIRLVIPELISCIGLVISQIPGAIKKLTEILEKWDIVPQDIINFITDIDWKSKIGEIANMLTSGVGSIMDIVFSALSSVFSVIINLFLGFIFAIYLLLGKDKLANQGNRLLKHYCNEKLYNKIIYVLEILHDCFRRYIIGQCTEAVILGVLCTLGMLILRLPYAAMIGALIAFTALIPVAGAYIGGGIGAFLILMVAPIKAIIFVIFLVLLQQFEGNLIYPRVVGSSMGLPAIWVLAAVTIGGGMLGVMGMLLGVPIAATAYRLIKNDIKKTDSNIASENKKNAVYTEEAAEENADN